MAKVIVYFHDRPNGLAVDCKVVPESGDSELAQRAAETVAAGLAGHVMAKVNDVVKKSKSRKGKANVH
ncbi:hypothetical protein H4F69_15010 [Pectobacterium brasiliense]|uniref:hypothetical protein n=1 Tax=Pectobacterium TaxID=122277 RepID=UPI0019696046|nr:MULTISPECIES: hypothetical protein [Pectobacterium]MBN3174856.1 hypothetical protein [Pectobacterium brasiliense]MBN3200771.1 hypothetical protein [Pectobacterium brasiliense]MBN3206038.1 hypothetical protein [Pectobacterium brasiliense]MDY4388594.1 hypothetical protein [Pectobacterium aroidearum]